MSLFRKKTERSFDLILSFFIVIAFITSFWVSEVFFVSAASESVQITEDVIWDADEVEETIYIDATSSFDSLEVTSTNLSVYEVPVSNFFLLKTDTHTALKTSPTENSIDFEVSSSDISTAGHLSGWDMSSSGEVDYIIGVTDGEIYYSVEKDGSEIEESPVLATAGEELIFSATGIGSYNVYGGDGFCNLTNVRGWAWSDTVGWISLSCMNEYDIGKGVDYGINIDEDTEKVSGQIWSDGVGWISFDESDLVGCPTEPCTAEIDTGHLVGWAKVLSTGDWISFSGEVVGESYKVNVIASNFHGWAWGDETLGWISFNCENEDECGVSDYKVWTTLVMDELIVRTDPAAKASSTDGKKVVLKGMLLGMGGDDDADVWFEWGETEETITKDTDTVQTLSGVGGFSSEITFTEEQFNETYYFKAVAENTEETSEGSVLSFTISQVEGDIIVRYKGQEKGIEINEEGVIRILD
jgi:hypothetical protein